MSAHQPQAAAGASSSAAPAAVHQLILQAELHAASVAEALTHYESALERLNQHIRSLPSGSAAQSQQIQRFGELLSTAELLKQQQQTNPSAAEYSWRQRQATRIAVEAVEADGGGRHNAALELYFKLLECLNRCHALETAPACQAAIMARFQVYLERAEQLQTLLQTQKKS